MSLVLLLVGCSDFNLILEKGPDPQPGPDICAFEVVDANGDIVVMNNEFLLEVLAEPERTIAADQFSQLARFQVSAVHPGCPGLTLEFADGIVAGTDESAEGWWEDLNDGGVAISNLTLDETIATSGDGSLIFPESGDGDAFEWADAFDLALYIPPGETYTLGVIADTSRASTGDHDRAYGRFGWAVISDGDGEVETVTNYSGDILTIL